LATSESGAGSRLRSGLERMVALHGPYAATAELSAQCAGDKLAGRDPASTRAGPPRCSTASTSASAGAADRLQGQPPRAVVRHFVETLQVVVRDRHCAWNADAHPIGRWPCIDDHHPTLGLEGTTHLLHGDEERIGRARTALEEARVAEVDGIRTRALAAMTLLAVGRVDRSWTRRAGRHVRDRRRRAAATALLPGHARGFTKRCSRPRQGRGGLLARCRTQPSSCRDDHRRSSVVAVRRSRSRGTSG